MGKIFALHVATHSTWIEARVFALLCKAGWHLVTMTSGVISHLRFRYRSRLFPGGDGFQVWWSPDLGRYRDVDKLVTRHPTPDIKTLSPKP